MARVIAASVPSWIAPLRGLSPSCFGKLVTVMRRGTVGETRGGRPWSLPLGDQTLLAAAYRCTNLTLGRLAPLFGISKSAAEVPAVTQAEH